MNMSTRCSVLLLLVTCASASRADSGTTAVELVARLYRDFAWEAVIDEPEWRKHELLNQPQTVLARYFDSNLTALIRRDRRCVATTREICNLDFSPIWASQDPGASGLKIVAGPTPEIVNVSFRYPGNGTKVELSYRTVKTRAGWRIADIRYGDGSSLVSVLSVKP